MDRRRASRTQGRFSLPNKISPKGVPPLNKSLDNEQNKLSPVQLRPTTTSDEQQLCAPLTYEPTVKEQPKTAKCKELLVEQFRKWIPLDPDAEEKSLIYFDPKFLSTAESVALYGNLKCTIPWEQKNFTKNGQCIPMPRLTYWYGPFDYSYGRNTSHKANREWTPEIVNLKLRMEEYLIHKADLDCSFNSVLLNYYRDCHDGVAWHSDDEISLGVNPIIGSISLGDTRKFELRKNDSVDAEWRLYLTNGSLLIMSGNTQVDWKHRVPTEYHDRKGRVNLTFRTIQNG